MTKPPSDPVLATTEVIDRITVFEACQLCEVQIEFVHSLVVEGVFEFGDSDAQRWVFDPAQFAVLRRAVRLHRDLGVNAPGIALALDLLQQLARGSSNHLAR